jgi:diaminopimelate decarboxylase
VCDFSYGERGLQAEAVPLSALADAVGTPFYCYSSAGLERAYLRFADAVANMGASICYALKANGNLAVVRTLASLGAGADVVSEGELRMALAACVPASRIVFSGVGKAASEMVYALAAGIHQINVESLPELELLSTVAAARGYTAPVALRVNPDVNAGTHEKITTGRRGNKFGIDFGEARAAYGRAASLPGIAPVGVAVHIGSQLTDMAPFRRAFGRIAALVRDLRADGHPVERIDLGGGLGISYEGGPPPDPAAYAAVAREVIAPLGCAITFEPGRSIVGAAGVLVTRVLYVKQSAGRRFVVVDAAMNDLARPALYDSHHHIRPVVARPGGEEPADIVGPICETTDTFATARPLPPVESGDLLAIGAAGAYGAVMSSTYNGRLLVPEVLVRGERHAVVRPRPDFDDLLGRDRLPDWLTAPGRNRTRGKA